MENRLPVEVLRDVMTPEVDTSIVLRGIELVNDITDSRIEVTNTKRQVRLSRPGVDVLLPSYIRWGASQHAMRIALSGLPLHIAGVERPVGFSSYNPKQGGGEAIISVAEPDAVNYSFVTAHEIGHLYNLTYEGEDRLHCPDLSCIMSQHIRRDRIETPVQRRGVQGLLQKAGLVEPTYRLVDEDLNDRFCTPCELQLARRSFYLLKHRSGQYVPASWR